MSQRKGSLLEGWKAFWAEDRNRLWLLLGGTLYAWLFTVGLPQWDDDFTSWHWNIRGQSFFDILLSWVSPISTQPQYWGFNERPFQSLIYKICHSISGYESWSYFLFKNFSYGGLWVAIYEWTKRLTSQNKAGIFAALLFGLAPGPIVSLYYFPDFAPVAELWIMVVGLWMWRSIEATPTSWKGLPRLSDRSQVEWIKKWTLISIVTYLGYKVKGDVRVLPMMLLGYVVLFRRPQWKLFAVPFSLMSVLAVPWGPGVLTRLPPWFPGSAGSEVGWMYRPANPGAAMDYISSTHGFGFWQYLIEPGFSYASVLGPFLLIAIVLFVGFKESGVVSPVRVFPVKDEKGRFGIWVAIWTVLALAILSALPELNHTFRVRYGILNLLPASILVGGWLGTVLQDSTSEKMKKFHPKAGTVFVGLIGALFFLQLGFNFIKSARHRTQLGHVMLMVDRVYEGVVQQANPPQKLLMVDGFRSYAYRPLVLDVIENRVADVSFGDLNKYPANTTQFISWKLYLDSRVEVIRSVDGCLSYHPFDWIVGCSPSSRATLYRWLGQSQPILSDAQAKSQVGDLAGASQLYGQYLIRHPENYGAMFELSLLLHRQGQFFEANRWEQKILTLLKENVSVLYNNSISLFHLDRCEDSLKNLKVVRRSLPKSGFGILYYQFQCGMKANMDEARDALVEFERQFPNDDNVKNYREQFDQALASTRQ